MPKLHDVSTVTEDASSDVLDRLIAWIVELSSGHLCAKQVDSSAPIFQRGYVDSLSHVELLARIEHTWQVRIAGYRLTGSLSTLASLADHIRHEAGGV